MDEIDVLKKKIKEGKCPYCEKGRLNKKEEISERGKLLVFDCGHRLKWISIEENIKLREIVKIKRKKEGIGGFLVKTVQGYKPSKDPKLSEGVDVLMTVNREKNKYDHIIKDNKTGDILHEEHCLLTDHKVKKIKTKKSKI